MNEELKITIKAATADAQKNIRKVKDGLGDMGQTAKKSSSTIDSAMSSVKKSIGSLVGKLVTLTASMVALDKGADFQQLQAKLNAAFQAMGSSVQQANKTFTDLYKFLGDGDRATEAAQNLARITTNAQSLSEWGNILQGVFATMGDALPVESLAEAANETINVGKVTGTLADALNWMGVSEDEVNAALTTMNTQQERELYLRQTLNGLYSNAATIYAKNNASLIAYHNAQLRLNQALAESYKALTPLLTALSNLASSLISILTPAFQTVINIISNFVSWIVTAIQYIAAFFGLFSSNKNTVNGAVAGAATGIGAMNKNLSKSTSGAAGLSSALGAAAANAKELKKQTMGFDELNIVSNPTTTSTSGGGSGGGAAPVEVPSIEPIDLGATGLQEFKDGLDETKDKLSTISTIILGIAAGIGLIKFANWITDVGTLTSLFDILNGVVKKTGTYFSSWRFPVGDILIMAGAMGTIASYADIFSNGLNLGNALELFASLSTVVVGLGIGFGNTVAAVGGLFAGIALLITGIVDLINNGYSMEAVILVVLGVLGTLTAAIWLLNAALLANPITWVVAAIILLVGTLVILYNECEGFRNWLNTAVSDIINWIKKAIEDIKIFFKNLVSWFKDKVATPISNFYKKWVKPPVDKIIEIIKKLGEIAAAVFGAGATLISNTVGKVVGWISDAWDKVSGFFSAGWNKIKEIFSPVVNFFKEIWNKAFNAVKTVFSPIVNFFAGVWDKIKDKFGSLGGAISNAISNAVKAGINGVISLIEGTINRAIGLINGAIKLINLLPGVNVSTIKELRMPRLAKGGIIDTATIAMVGEQGKEAVVPLENNTEWMDKLASRLAAKQNTPSKIVLMVDGRELGWASIKSINGITQQTGSLQLTLA